MKNRFVKISLILAMLLTVAAPAQVFAADNNWTTSQSNLLNTQISKIYSQLPQAAISNMNAVLARYQNVRIDASQLQALMNQIRTNNTTVAVPVTSAPAPAKQTTTATAPVKQTNTATAAPAKPAATTPVKPATTPSATTQTQSGATASTIGAYEQQVVDLVNKERAAAGLPALKVNTKLSGVAEKKAEDMRDKNYFSHTSPTYGSPFDMMKQFGVSYTAAGENIAKGQRTPSEVMNGWMNSPGHRANILNANYTEIGVGYVTDSSGNTYWVQHFIRP